MNLYAPNKNLIIHSCFLSKSKQGKKKFSVLNYIKQVMGLLWYFWSEIIWKYHIERICNFMSQFEMKGIYELDGRLGIPGSFSSHIKFQALWENQKFISCYLEFNVIVHGSYKMLLSNQYPYWRAVFLTVGCSNYSPCSFTPAQC